VTEILSCEAETQKETEKLRLESDHRRPRLRKKQKGLKLEAETKKVDAETKKG